jgi:exodeoxyribonuclease V gamma subunit
MLYLYPSNKTESLATVMAEIMRRQPLSDPFTPEVVLTQSHGMGVWLEQQISEKLGIAAMIDVQMPGAFVWCLIEALLPDDSISEEPVSKNPMPKDSPASSIKATSVQHFEKQNLKWEIFNRLPELIERPEFINLRSYIDRLMHSTHAQDPRAALFRLSELLADVFDGYQNSRPEWVASWEKGELANLSPDSYSQSTQETQAWQAQLWRELYPNTPLIDRKHRSRQIALLQATLRRGSGLAEQLPKRIFVFGMSVLPPQWLPLFLSLGRTIDIHLLAQNPCRYYWGDVQSERQQLMVEKRRLDSGQSILRAQQEVVEGNPLLASWGRLGKEYLGELYKFDQQDGVEELSFDLYEDYADAERDQDYLSDGHEDAHEELAQESANKNESLAPNQQSFTALQRVQNDILNLDHTKNVVSISDPTIRFARCHSRLREVEVLKDYLLTVLDQDSSLSVRDIIVMVPDIQDYSALVHAVFGMPVRTSSNGSQTVGGASGTSFLPYGISDHSLSVDQPLLESLLSILNLTQSRVSVTEVFDFLDVEAIRTKLELSDSDLSFLQALCEGLNVRWGLSEQHRDEHISTQQSGEANTWTYAFKRALLGYLAGSQDEIVEGVLACELSSTEQNECLGKLIYFIDLIDETRNTLSGELSLSEWADVLNRLWRLWFDFDELDEAVLRLMEQGLLSMDEQATVSGYGKSLPFKIVASVLTQQFEKEKVSQRFLSGRINFCTLMPMRTIPFKVVCLLGMNEADYPRRDLPQNFDLMTMLPRRACDRSRRDDDRYLFLEAVLSARRSIYVSHVGYAAKDNSERYPSVLVSELREYIVAQFSTEDGLSGQDLLANWTQEHRLQAFNKEYFLATDVTGNQQKTAKGIPLTQSYASEWESLFYASGLEEAAYLYPENSGTHISCSDRPSPEAFEADTNKEKTRELALDALTAAVSNPLAYYYQTSLGLSQWGTKESNDDREPFSLDGLDAYFIKERLFESSADVTAGDHHKDQHLFEHLRAEGVLARPPLDAMQFGSLVNETSGLREHMLSFGRPTRINFQGLSVSGSNDQISGDLFFTEYGQVELSLSKGVGRHFFGVWLKHVVWNYYLHHRESKLATVGTTHYISASQHITLPALSLDTSVTYLLELLGYYDEVLAEPKLFLPETAYAQLFGSDADVKNVFYGGFSRSAESAALFWQRACYLSGLNQDAGQIPDVTAYSPVDQVTKHRDPDFASRKKRSKTTDTMNEDSSESNLWISVEKFK